MNRKIVLAGILIAGLVMALPAASARYHWDGHIQTRGECTPFNELGCESEYVDNDHTRWTDDYQRGGIRTNYFDPIFETERERSYSDRYDRRYRNNNRYDNRYNNGGFDFSFGFSRDIEDHPLEWSEGFVAGEGYGDEYIGDSDQLNEEIPSWPY